MVIKRLSYFSALLMVAGIAFLFGCGDDTEVEPVGSSPSITFTGADADSINSTSPTFSGSVGDSFDVNVSVSAPDGFNVLRVNKIVNGTSTKIDEFLRTTAGQTDFSTSYSYTLVEADADASVQLEFEAVDEDSDTSTETITIVISEPLTNLYTAVLLPAPLVGGDSKNFFSSEDGNVYSDNDVTTSGEPISETIDFGYYYGTTDNASLASPDAFPTLILSLSGWNTLNQTGLKITTLTESNFNEANTPSAFETIYNDATAGGDPEVVSQLSVGQIVTFKTDASKSGGSKYGLIKIDALVPGDGSNGEIQITVKVAN